MMPNQDRSKQKQDQPTIAPGMEIDELEEEATEEEIANGDYTEVTSLIIDRLPRD